MTVIVGILCMDGGIVVAADSAATFSTSTGALTAKQPTTKLSIIDNQVIFGHSGRVGLSQRLEEIAKDSWEKKKLSKKYNPTEAMQFLRNRFWEDVVKDEVEVAEKIEGSLAQLAQQGVMHDFLIALPPIKETNKPCLIHFNWNCFPEMLSGNLPCVALGSGQQIADPFLSFIRLVFWNNGAPSTIADGLFAAILTLRYVFKTSPAFVSGPEQIMVLKPGSEELEWIAEEMSDENLGEHFENVDAFEEYTSRYPQKFRPQSKK